ncbi:hypothetical protein GIB67_021926 [Kingdonia uniflora]|uniref:phospholipase D n=1 Tax=Kingdonia uniflora TaxID=39325 RepID=A0A7J7N4D5_9MAGN|nr:hypothetical protein GIB67_021926 [Kingdonia uniflora]
MHNKTMQMMYETLYKALEEVGLENTYVLKDYLNFFCLGNCEASDGTKLSIGGSPTASNTPHISPFIPHPNALAKKNRRFMIYVHSKGMIVDDEYVIIGSANIISAPWKVFLGQSGGLDTYGNQLPRLVYVSREKRPGHNHHKKVGAMNALFPQRFDGIDRNDQYASRNTVFFDINMKGLDDSRTHLCRDGMCFPKAGALWI